ncbi:N-acetyl-D-Glu racemase DgcA [Rubellimicrobium sp. CFH 75288]|uniref:N-acetyl-D-Glu racemase DgcA n=1 Tax=Rubellimicrobium sp. CFH 75288 TaxID=2697034 RepID=UPI00141343D2|nr:N-acetyl-D-Glu racemase DgcA [Rubellimicrobium sp. CFH 75288]NAZ37993.1 dipeptide epimerase [Rubellimicrobium sp. CFH 75288]
MFSATIEDFPLARAFTISRGSRTHARVVVARLARDGAEGRGECVPYPRYGETPEAVAAAIAALPPDATRAALPHLLPPGAARNAADCALWDWEARRTGRRVWDLAGLPPPRPVPTAFTLSLDEPAAMEARAREEGHRPLLKVKLGTPDDLPRLEAVRRGAPTPRLIVDANEGWREADYRALLPHLERLRVALVEQPFPEGEDGALARLPRPVPVCADESCRTRESLPALAGLYDAVNVKLDKAGGLTEALALADAARRQGLSLMVGCMVATSLAVAPAVLLAQGAAIADLDGPLLLAQDRAHGLRCDDAGLHPPEPALWG